jgi:hypothetical protein
MLLLVLEDVGRKSWIGWGDTVRLWIIHRGASWDGRLVKMKICRESMENEELRGRTGWV